MSVKHSAFEYATYSQLEFFSSALAGLAITLAPHLPGSASSGLQSFVDQVSDAQRKIRDEAALLTLMGQGFNATALRRVFGEQYEAKIEAEIPKARTEGEALDLREVMKRTVGRRVSWSMFSAGEAWFTSKVPGEKLWTKRPELPASEMFDAPITRSDSHKTLLSTFKRWRSYPGEYNGDVALVFSVTNASSLQADHVVQIRLTREDRGRYQSEGGLDYQIFTWVEIEKCWVCHKRLEYLPADFEQQIEHALDRVGIPRQNDVSKTIFIDLKEIVDRQRYLVEEDGREITTHSYSTAESWQNGKLNLHLRFTKEGEFIAVSYDLNARVSVMVNEDGMVIHVKTEPYRERYDRYAGDTLPNDTQEYFGKLLAEIIDAVQTRQRANT